MGTILGEHNINIADMTVGRSRLWEVAVTLINVDSPVPPARFANDRFTKEN